MLETGAVELGSGPSTARPHPSSNRLGPKEALVATAVPSAPKPGCQARV